jgi:hypothetical protein
VASVVSILIAARSTAAAALSQARAQTSALASSTAALSRRMFAQTRAVSSVAGAYRDANGLWRNANGTLLTQRHTVTHVRTAWGHLTNAIQRTTRALVVYTGVAMLARSLSDGRRIGQLAASFGLLAAKAAAAVAVILPITGVIGNLIPLVMLLAPAAGTAGLAMVGLKIAFMGVKEALDAGLSGDTEEFEKALKKLAPQAASAVRAMVKVRDQWKGLFKGFQGRVFEGAAGEILALSNIIKPVADRWLPRLGLRFAEVRNQLAEGLASFGRDGRLEAVWRNLHIALSNVLDVVKPLARAFGDVLEVAAPRFVKVAESVRGLAMAFSDWIRQAKESGKLGEWLDKAMTTFGKLKEIASNVGQIIGAIFKASGNEGDSMLDQIANSTAAIAKWANSGDGQKMIDWASKLFQVLGQFAPLFEVWVGWMNGMGIAWSALWSGMKGIFTFVVMWILDGYGMLVNAAAKAFGWIPGLGDKLKSAAQSFNAFRDQVNQSLNGIQKTIDITVNYRARMIGPHLVSGAQQSGTYSSGIGGRASGGNASGLRVTGENGPEIIDFNSRRVYNNNQSRRMIGGGGLSVAGGDGASGGVMITFGAAAPGNHLANAMLEETRAGRIPLQVRVGGQTYRVKPV